MLWFILKLVFSQFQQDTLVDLILYHAGCDVVPPFNFTPINEIEGIKEKIPELEKDDEMEAPRNLS